MRILQFLDIKTDYIKMQCTCFNCGGQEFPYMLAQFTHTCITLVKIVIPVLLIVLGIIDMFKATTSQKEDDMKKAQRIFIKRIISALLVFFVVTIVQFGFGMIANLGFGDATECLNSFINGNPTECKCKSCVERNEAYLPSTTC